MTVKLDESVAFAALSVAVVETIKLYSSTAPTLRELRRASPGDFESRQLMLDADILGLVIVVALGGGGSFLMKRWYPVILAGFALILISGYYHSVLNSANEGLRNE